MTPIRSFVTLAVLALISQHGAAQTAPAKPAVTPPTIVMPAAAPAKAPARTLGGKTPAGKMLSRDELRACMNRLEGVNAAAKDLGQRRAALDKEKVDLVKSGEALQAEKAGVETKLAAVRDWEARVRAHGAEIETFNQRLKAADEGPKSKRDEMAKELDAERERLNQARLPLSEDEARLVPVYQNAVKSYNDNARARDALVADWNERNKALNESSTKHDDERASWLTECADRPYREDDEIAIKKGK
jgi:chromosome segregation ATPase